MDDSNAVFVLEKLGCRKIRVTGGEVYSTCPNGSAHARGFDRHPSFSAKIDPSNTSPFFCHACEFSGSLEYLATQHGIGDFDLEVNVQGDWIPPTNKELFGWSDPKIFFPPEEALEYFTKSLPGYTLNRGFGKETAKHWELGFDKENRFATFTVRDRESRLRGISGRAISPDRIPKYTHYSWDLELKKLVPFRDKKNRERYKKFEKSKVLYGEHLVARGEGEGEFIVVCEGHYDAIRLWMAGFRAVALMGSAISDEQLHTLMELLQLGWHVVMAFDQDKAGHKCRDNLVRHLVNRVPLFDAVFPDGLDPASYGDPSEETHRDLRELEEIILGADIWLD